VFLTDEKEKVTRLRSKIDVVVDYTAIKLRAYLSKDQKFILNQWCGSMRFIWNEFLKIKNRRYKKWIDEGKPLTQRSSQHE
jgi:hypothetical protein